jgi:serine/threonine protein kinase
VAIQGIRADTAGQAMAQASTSRPPAELPERLGRYHVLGVAGQGSMGIVYTGYDPAANVDVAIKVCTLDPAADERTRALQRKLFFNEAHIAGLLDHPNIVRLLDAEEENGQLYIAMEHVAGCETLARHCDPGNLLPFETVARIIHTCARALDYAHRRGVVHRDIKPSNILLTADGVLKLADFGIAQSAVSEATQVLGLVGSPHYMSPEQVAEKPLTGQTDLYSLGVVMFQLLTGRRPFTARSLPSLVERIRNDPPPPVHELRPEVPEPLARIVERALQKEPTLRYSSGREMAADLARVFADLEDPGHSLSDDMKFELTRALRVFAEFSDAEIWEVIRASHWHEYPDGSPVATDGGVDLAFFILVAGEVLVSKGQQPILSLSRGDCFADLPRITDAGDSVAVMAVEDVALLKVSAAGLDRASADCQLHFYKAFVRILIERLTRRDSGRRSPAPAAAVRLAAPTPAS